MVTVLVGAAVLADVLTAGLVAELAVLTEVLGTVLVVERIMGI